LPDGRTVNEVAEELLAPPAEPDADLIVLSDAPEEGEPTQRTTLPAHLDV
jgi:hypothetical protein